MFYSIAGGLKEEAPEEAKGGGFVAVLSEQEIARNGHGFLRELSPTKPVALKTARFCKLETEAERLVITLCRPPRGDQRARLCIAAVLHGGNLLLIDCRANKGELVPMNDPSVSIIVCNSNKKHQLTGSEYPDRVRQCKEAVAVLATHYPDVKALRDATVEQVESVKNELGDLGYRRALHVVSECQRCLDCKRALEARDYEKVGQLLLESHASLRDNYEVSTPEISSRMRLPICPSSSISPSTVSSRPRTHFMGCLSKNCRQNSTSLMCLPSYQSGHACGVISIFDFLLVNFV